MGHQTTHKSKLLLFSMEADTDYGHMEAKFLILCCPNSNPNPKMGANSSTENTKNAPEFIGPICLPNPKKSGFQ